jgi:hypothetical protein
MERFKTKESLAKQCLPQAAQGNLGPDAKKSRKQNRKEGEEQLQQLVSNFFNMELNSYVEALITFFD